MGYRFVDTPADLAEVVDALAEQPAIALDTEFHREKTFHPKVALVQLAWDNEIVVLDALALDLASLTRAFGPDTVVVMHAASQDMEALVHVCGTAPERLFDTQLAAGFLGYATPSLSSLIEGELGIRLPKGDRLTDWLRRPLGSDALTYAASDVEHLLQLYRHLVERLEAVGRLQWAEDECDTQRRRSGEERDPDVAWWRVKEARQLRGKSVGVAQSLAAWRERRASEVDQPVRFVLPDLALVGIAQRPPTSPEEIRRVRGLDERHVRGGAARGILAAVEEGLALTREQLRFPPAGDVDRELRPAVALASAWLSQLGRQLHIDTALLATRSDLEGFLRGDSSSRLASGWRSEAVGDALQRLIGGTAALAFEGNGTLVLEERSNRPVGPGSVA